MSNAQYHLPLKWWFSAKFHCQPRSRLTAGAGEEGHDNAAMPAAHDGAHVMFIMPRHRSHKSCIAPHSWGKCSSSCMHQVSLWSRWPPSLVPLSLSHSPYPMRISHFYIVSCPIDFTTSTLTLLLFIALLFVFFLFNKSLSPLMPQCLSSLIWRQLWPNSKTSCSLL